MLAALAARSAALAVRRVAARSAPHLALVARHACGAAPQTCKSAFAARRALSTGVLSQAQLLQNEADKTQIGGFSDTGFMVNNAEVEGSIFCTPQIFLCWEPNTLDEVTPAMLEPLTLLHPKPDVVLIGTGAASQALPLALLRFFQQHQVNFEVSSSVNTVSTFNVLVEEGRNVVAFVLHLNNSGDASRPE